MTQALQRSFGVRVAGVPLLLPEGTSLEYVAAAPLYPLPRAGSRVAGLMQLRGHPVVVLDAAPQPGQWAGGMHRVQVLVIGEVPECGALIVESPPCDVEAGAEIEGREAPDCAFRVALAQAVADGAKPGDAWWRFDARRLFEALAGG